MVADTRSETAQAARDKVAAFLDSLPEPLVRRGEGAVTPKAVTARIREETALALKAGLIPKGTKLSIRCLHYKSVHVDVTEWSRDGALHPDYLTHVMERTQREIEGKSTRDLQYDHDDRMYREGRQNGHYRTFNPRLTDALNETLSLLWAIASRHNYDNSDPMTDYFDVGYYLDVTANPVIGAAEHGVRMELDPKFRALLQRAMEASNRLGEKCVKAVCGRAGLEHCSQWSLENLIRIDERAQGRPVAYDKRRRGWFPMPTTAEIEAEYKAKRELARYHSDLDTGRR